MRDHKRDHKIEQLQQIRPFRSLARRELSALSSIAELISVDAGAVLTTEATSGREVFVIRSGTATVWMGGEAVATVGAGEFVGELALLDRNPRTATVVADGPLELVVFGPREFSGVLADFPSIARHVMRGMSGRLRTADAALVAHG